MARPPSSTVSIDAANEGRRLDVFLRQLLPTIGLGKIMKWIRTGAVRRNELKAKPSDRLKEGDTIALPVALAPARAATSFHPASAPRPGPTKKRLAGAMKERPHGGGAGRVPPGTDTKLEVLFEDEHLLVVAKPAGLACHAGSGHEEDSLLARVIRMLGAGSALPGHRPGLAQRLDRDVSGVIVVGKDAPTLRALTDAVARGAADKTYLALVAGVVAEPDGVIELPLRIDEAAHGGQIRARPDSQGLPARTSYCVIERFTDASLLSVRIATGRMHQIRAHMRAIGHPVAGDSRYGSESPYRALARRLGLSRPFLHASSIDLELSRDEPPRHFDAPLPEELTRVLELLREEGRRQRPGLPRAEVCRLAYESGCPPPGNDRAAQRELERALRAEARAGEHDQLEAERFVGMAAPRGLPASWAVTVKPRTEGSFDIRCAVVDAAALVESGGAAEAMAATRGLATVVDDCLLPLWPLPIANRLAGFAPEESTRVVFLGLRVSARGEITPTGCSVGRARAAIFEAAALQALLDDPARTASDGALKETLAHLRPVAETLRQKGTLARAALPHPALLEPVCVSPSSGWYALGEKPRFLVEQWFELLADAIGEAASILLQNSAHVGLQMPGPRLDPSRWAELRARVGALGRPLREGETAEQYLSRLDTRTPLTHAIRRLWLATVPRETYVVSPGETGAGPTSCRDLLTPAMSYAGLLQLRLLRAASTRHTAEPPDEARLLALARTLNEAREREAVFAARLTRALSAATLLPYCGRSLKAVLVDFDSSRATLRLEQPAVEIELPASALVADSPAEATVDAQTGAPRSGHRELRLGDHLEIALISVDPSGRVQARLAAAAC